MKLYRYLLAALLCALLPAAAHAQCTGAFESGRVCANSAVGRGIAASVTVASLFDRVFGTTDNRVLARTGGSWQSTATLPSAVQDNITRLGTIVSGVWTGTAIANANLANPSLTIGSTNIALGATATTIGGLSAPTNGSDAATKDYVDAIGSGTHFIASVKYATTTALAANTYNNGASGVGATLTGNVNGSIGAIDGTIPSVADRLLIKDEATQSHNGPYAVTTVGNAGTPYVLTRTTDADQVSSTEISNGMVAPVTAGATNIGSGWILVQPAAITIGTTALPFTQYPSGVSLWSLSGSDIQNVNAGQVKVSNLTTLGLTGFILGANTSAATAVTATGTGNVMRATAPTMTGNLILNGNWLSGDGGNEGVFVGSTGLVGIGNSSPAAQLDMCTTGTAAHCILRMATAGGSTYHSSIDMFSSGTSYGFNLTNDDATPPRFKVTRHENSAGGVDTLTVDRASGETIIADHHKFNTGGTGQNNSTITTSGDQTSAINAALAVYDIVQLPCGTFSIAGTITLARNGQTFAGSGSCTKILNTNVANSTLVAVTDLSDVVVRDMLVDADSKGTGACLWLTHATRTKVRNFECDNVTANTAIVVAQTPATTNGSDYTLLENCVIRNNSGSGEPSLYFSVSHYGTITGCKIINSSSGIGWAASNGITITGNSINGTGGSGTDADFGGLRCSNGSKNGAVTGNTLTNLTRGFFLIGCQQTAFTGNSVRQMRSNGAFLESNDNTDQHKVMFNTLTGNTFEDLCLSGGGCVVAISLVVQGTSVPGNMIGNIVLGNTMRDNTSAIAQGISATGTTLGANTCSSNTANVTVGGC